MSFVNAPARRRVVAGAVRLRVALVHGVREAGLRQHRRAHPEGAIGERRAVAEAVD